MQSRNRSAPILSSLKLSFFKHRLFETFTGGLSLESDKASFILIKLILYLIPLVLILIPALLTDFYIAVNISGGAGVFILLIIYKFPLRYSHKTFPINLSSSNKNDYKMKKNKILTSLGYLLISVIIGYFYFFLTTAFLWNTYRNEEISNGLCIFEIVLICLITITSASSIFFGSPKEFASVLPDDKPFNLFSAALMRPFSVIIILIIQIVYTNFWYNVIISIIYFSLLPLWTFGMIGSILNTLIWGLETLNRVVFGDVLKNRFEVLFMAFIFNCCLSIILTIVLTYSSDSSSVAFYLIMTEISLLKTLKISKLKDFYVQTFEFIFFLIFMVFVAVEVLADCLSLSQAFTAYDIYFQKGYQTLLIILGVIAAACCFVQWIIGNLHRKIYLKFIKNPWNIKMSSTILKILYYMSQMTLCHFIIACSFGHSSALQNYRNKNLLEIWVWSAFLLRSFNLCWYYHLKLFLHLLEVN